MDAGIIRFCEIIQSHGGTALLVGGYVRDMVLGINPKDFDFEIYYLEVENLITILEKIADKDVIRQRSFPVWKLHFQGLELDVAIPRRDNKVGAGHADYESAPDPFMTIFEAAKRRDFTCNSMAFNPLTGEIHDPLGGQNDLLRKMLRIYDSQSFAEDSLRVFRAVQFCSRMELTCTPLLIKTARVMHAEIPDIKADSIFQEIWKGLVKGKSGLHFLQAILDLELHPLFAKLKNTLQEPDWHPEGDVFVHTQHVLQSAMNIATRENLSDEDRFILCMAAICHDLGKITHTQQNPGERITSHGHVEAGEFPTRQLLADWGVPPKFVEPIVGLVLLHMVHVGSKISQSMVRRLSVKAKNYGVTIKMIGHIVESDHSGRPPLEKGIPANMQTILQLAEEINVGVEPPAPIVTGKFLLNLGFKPGKEMGEIIRASFEAQLNGLIGDEKDAIAYLSFGGCK